MGFDDLRMGFQLQKHHDDLPLEIVDGLDTMMRCRIVKTAPALETFRRVGRIADQCLAAASAALRPGVTWDEVQYDVADAMTRLDAIPVDEGPMLFGGAFAGEFIPELFRTRYDKPLEEGQIIILETGHVRELLDRHQPHGDDRSSHARVPGTAQHVARGVSWLWSPTCDPAS